MLIWGLPSRQPNSLQIWGLLKVWLFQGPPDNSLPLTSFRHIRPNQTPKSKPVSHFNFTELTPIGYQTGHQLAFLRGEHASYRIGKIRILICSYCPEKSWVSSVFHVRRSIKRRASTLLVPTLATRPDLSRGGLSNHTLYVRRSDNSKTVKSVLCCTRDCFAMIWKNVYYASKIIRRGRDLMSLCDSVTPAHAPSHIVQQFLYVLCA